jgi:UDP-hydrolysing UDP-N-acetyl-D-glucosamine 2-epimerase
MIPRVIGVVTVARSDYGIYRSVLERIRQDPALRLHLIVAGSHLVSSHGSTVSDIEADGFAIGERVEMLLASDTPEAIATSMGVGVMRFASIYRRTSLDILMVLGDRFEMLSAVLAALPFALPIAHLHGGERTEGAIDEAIRHAMTKMSHLHFVATEEYARRVIQLGEEPWRVHVTGGPGLDQIARTSAMSREELGAIIGCELDPPPVIVTYHPETLDDRDVGSAVRALLDALDELALPNPIVFTHPNADAGREVIVKAMKEYVGAHGNAHIVVSLGTRRYLSLMSHAAVMIGNSSSGIVEAASFELPAVNIGDRQAGRMRAANVVDVPMEREAIVRAVRKALDPSFRRDLHGLRNPYGDGHAAERIVDHLRSAKLGRGLVVKRFHDVGMLDSETKLCAQRR